MKTRVQSAYVAQQIRKMKKKSGMKAFRVDLVEASSTRTSYFSDYHDALKYAARMANKIVGKAHVYENVGGMEFVYVLSYETESHLPKAPEPEVRRSDDCAVGISSDQRWKDAFKRPVTIMIRRHRRSA